MPRFPNGPKIFNQSLPRPSLITICKSFIGLILLSDYGDLIYNRPNNVGFLDKIKSIQYNAALVLKRAIRGISKDKFYQELGIESLKDKGWLRRLSYLNKIVPTKLPPYLYEIIPCYAKVFSSPYLFQTFTMAE